MYVASFGLLTGAQSQGEYILFMTQDALIRFESSNGWTSGVHGLVTLRSVGANAGVTTQTAQQPIIVFVLTYRGRMGNLSLKREPGQFPGSQVSC